MESTVELYDPRYCIVFRKVNEPFGDLSNMACGYPIVINGIEIATSEALYQACRFPHRADIQRAILKKLDPMEAKRLSRSVNELSRGDWASVRIEIMHWCLRMKLVHNSIRFANVLDRTEDKTIVEYSKADEFWGAKPYSASTLRGHNMLGKLLIELRREMRIARQRKSWRFMPPKIPSFLLLGSEIGNVSVSPHWL